MWKQTALEMTVRHHVGVSVAAARKYASTCYWTTNTLDWATTASLEAVDKIRKITETCSSMTVGPIAEEQGAAQSRRKVATARQRCAAEEAAMGMVSTFARWVAA